MSMRIVITGAAGFIGSHLTERLIKVGHKCTAVDDLSIHEGDLPDWMKWARTNNSLSMKRLLGGKGNCTTKYACNEIRLVEPEIIFNLAVMPLPHSLEHPMENFEINTKITQNMLEICRSTGARLIHFSSSEIYGTIDRGYLTEESTQYPTTPYAAAKAACDHLVNSYVKTYGIKASIVRPFNAVGPRQNDKAYAAIIPRTVKRIKEGLNPQVFGDGSAIRDYTAVNDIVDGAIRVLEEPNIAQGETFNICTGIETSSLQMIRTICNILNYNGNIKYTPARMGDVMRHQGDYTKAMTLLGWTPRTPLWKAVENAITE